MNLVALAMKIRSVRQERGLTLQQLADRAGLTSSVLSKVENFRVTPSLAALGRIADGLGVSASSLLDGLSEKPVLVVVSEDERELVDRDGEDSVFTYYALANKRPNKSMEPFLVEIPAGKIRKELLAHEDDEFFMLLEGELDFEYGDTVYHIHRGDCVYADGTTRHRLINTGTDTAKILIVFAKPV